MNKVSLIGLGAMGRALGQALLAGGCELTLWNRTPAKAETLVANGAKLAESPAQAVASSDIVVICIIDYAVTYELLDRPDITSLLEDRIIVQLTTGTPAEAREMAQWVTARGGEYIDGSIMVYPPTIGSEAAQLLVSGEPGPVKKIRPLLDKLGGDICESEGVSLQQFAAMFPEGDRARSVALSIHDNEFEENISASVDVAIGVASSIRRQAEERQINSEFPDYILGLYQRAAAAGYRQQDTSALVKILRGTAYSTN